MPIKGSVCPHDCPSTCALDVEVTEDGRIGAVRGADNSYTAGVVCGKVARYRERVHHPDRLTYPLLRTGPKGSGQFRQISWEEALDRTAEAMQGTARRFGSEAVWPYYFAGTMGHVQRDGINRLRYENRFSGQNLTICSSIAQNGWLAGCGHIRGADPREMAEADLIIIWGTNPVATQVNVMTHVTRARKGRGAKLVVIDPYRNGTAQQADIHLPIRPATDGALACAVMHIAFRDGYADCEYMARYTDDPLGLERHLATRTPEWASAITGLSVAAIEDFARLYGTTERAFIRAGYGFTRVRNGAAAMHAVSCLPAVTGKWKHRGGGAFWNARGLYHWDKRLIWGSDMMDPTIRVLDMSRIGPVLTGDRHDLGDGPPVSMLFIQNQNPVVVAPESRLVARGFAREDLYTVVHEQFLTPTARMADLVLPATMFLEHDDIYEAGGHPHIQIGPKLVEPPGECRSNHEVLCGIARRLGSTHRAWGMTAMEIIDETLRASGWPSAKEVIARRWIDVQPSFEDAHFLNGFGHPDGKFRFRPDWKALGPLGRTMPGFPDHFAVEDAATAERPFRLVTAPARQFLNTSFTETPTSRAREGAPRLLIHPDDAARLGVAEGERVTLGNARGEVTVPAKLFAGMQPGVLVVESVWPNDDFEGGQGINVLTSADPAGPSGGAVFHDTAVWAKAAEARLALAAE